MTSTEHVPASRSWDLPGPNPGDPPGGEIRVSDDKVDIHIDQCRSEHYQISLEDYLGQVPLPGHTALRDMVRGFLTEAEALEVADDIRRRLVNRPPRPPQVPAEAPAKAGRRGCKSTAGAIGLAMLAALTAAFWR